MAIDPNIRDQAYQFFIEEAPELLNLIESGLLALSHDRSTTKIHTLMRAAHSIKGGASSVGLDAIATLAHRLENIFKALYDEALTIDTELENQLLRAFDCLRLPLMEQLMAGSFDAEQSLAAAEPILAQIEERCGDALNQTETYIPSSSDLGIDIVTSIFEVDVVQGLERLARVIAEPDKHEVAGELRSQIEVFAGFAELLNLPGFGAITATVQRALETHPDRALDITQLALVDFERSRQAVLAGDRKLDILPSPELAALADATNITDGFHQPSISDPGIHSEAIPEIEESIEDLNTAIPWLENVFGEMGSLTETAMDDYPIIAEANYDLNDFDQAEDLEDTSESFLEENFENPIITPEVELDKPFTPDTSDTEWIIDATSVTGEVIDELFSGQAIENTAIELSNSLVPLDPRSGSIQLRRPDPLPEPDTEKPNQSSTYIHRIEPSATPNLTVRVDSERLERMNNLVGELIINRDGLSLQNEQLQSVLRELLTRFSRFQNLITQFRDLSDQMIIAPEQRSYEKETIAETRNTLLTTEENSARSSLVPAYSSSTSSSALVEFDPLEMDRYGALHLQMQEILEDLVQLEEAVDDISLFARQSSQHLDQQRQTLTHLQSELKWARMLPLGELLNRFPRVLRDLSTTYGKPVNLKLIGTEILVDKAILEKLYDPLLHLLRNAFDHGIEPPEIRRQRGKPDQGQIEIRAYHKGNQTIIEVRDDGQGLNLERIRSRAFELSWLTSEQLLSTTPNQLFELIFEPGFSTASRVSELSGRGVGLDVVRSQLAAIKGSVSVASFPGQGTTFTLHLPLTLTIARLIVGMVGASAFAFAADSIEEILTPQADQIKQSGNQRFLYWRDQIIPVYQLASLLDYACPIPETLPSKALIPVATPKDWAPPLLILQQEREFFALEVDRLVNEQELVIKPFGTSIAPPSYASGCTILGDGSLIPVIDAEALLAQNREHQSVTATVGFGPRSTMPHTPIRQAPTLTKTIQAPTILIVDDAITLRRTLALSLEREGFRVLQARDGWEAIDQLQQTSSVKLVICDVEMPNMNGFEFLTYRRQDAQLSQIPVVMLTSRSNEKHRWLAKQLGATDYFTKPYLEQEFLTAIKLIVSSPMS